MVMTNTSLSYSGDVSLPWVWWHVLGCWWLLCPGTGGGAGKTVEEGRVIGPNVLCYALCMLSCTQLNCFKCK